MLNLDRIRESTLNFCNTSMQGVQQIKKGVASWGAEIEIILADFTTVTGQLPIIKTALATMRVASLFPRFNGTFDKALPYFENLKNIHYATMTIVSIPLFYYRDENNHVHFQFPQLASGGGFDAAKFFYSIGGVCGTVAFFHKLDAIRIEFFTKASEYIGSVLIYMRKDRSFYAKDVIFLNSLCESPQEFLFFLASCVEVYRWIKNVYSAPSSIECKRYFEWETLLKTTSSIGRAICLGFRRSFRGSETLLWVDFVGQWSGKIAFIIKNKKERNKRFNEPIPI